MQPLSQKNSMQTAHQNINKVVTINIEPIRKKVNRFDKKSYGSPLKSASRGENFQFSNEVFSLSFSIISTILKRGSYLPELSTTFSSP